MSPDHPRSVVPATTQIITIIEFIMLTSNVNDALITNEVEDMIPIENSCNSSGIAPMYGHHYKHFPITLPPTSVAALRACTLALGTGIFHGLVLGCLVKRRGRFSGSAV